MARLPTKQDEQSILRSFANMQNDIASGSPPEFLANSIAPLNGDMAEINGIPPFNNAPTFEQAFESGLSVPQAAAVSGKVASRGVKSQIQNEIRAAQNTPENRANMAANQIIREYPVMIAGVGGSVSDIVLESFSASFGVPKEAIQNAIDTKKQIAEDTAFPDPAPVDEEPTDRPWWSPGPLHTRLGLGRTPEDEESIKEQGQGTNISPKTLLEDFAQTDTQQEDISPYITDSNIERAFGDIYSNVFRAKAQNELGPASGMRIGEGEDTRLDVALRGANNALGMWYVWSVIKDIPLSSTSFNNYLNSEEKLDVNDPKVQEVLDSMTRASSMKGKYADDLGPMKEGLWTDTWTEKMDPGLKEKYGKEDIIHPFDKKLTPSQKQIIGNVVSDSGAELAVVFFREGITGRGDAGKYMAKGHLDLLDSWEAKPQLSPDEPITGFIYHADKMREPSKRKRGEVFTNPYKG